MCDITKKEKYTSFFVFIFVIASYHLLFTFLKFPIHDTRGVYEAFYVVYNSLVSYQQIPFWFSQITYGIPTDNTLISALSFPDILVLAIGSVLKAKDSLTLFYIASNLELFIFVWGGYLLGRLYFSRKNSAVLFSLLLLLSSSFFYQAFFNLRIFMYLPFIGYFFHLGILKRDLSIFLRGGLVFCLSLLGVPPYFLFPITLFTLTCTIAAYFEVEREQNFKLLIQDIWINYKRNYVVTSIIFVLIVVFLLAWLSIVLNLSKSLTLISPGRQDNGVVPLQSFLSYGAHPSMKKFFEFIYALPSNLSSTIFLGVCPLIFLIFTFIYVKRPIVTIYGLMVLCLILLSMADATVIPSIFYYLFPGANVYRHIGLLLSTIHFFAIFCAVCGYDRLISSSKEQRQFYITRLIAISSGTLFFIWFINKIFRWRTPYDIQWHGMFLNPEQFRYVSILSVIIFLIVLTRYKNTNKNLPEGGLADKNLSIYKSAEQPALFAIAIFSVIILEISSYAFYIHNNDDLTITKDFSKLSSPRILENNLWRENDYSENIKKVIDDYNSSKYVRYSLRDAFLGRSLCVTNGRVDLLNTSLHNLLAVVSPNEEYKAEKLTGWNKLRERHVISNSPLKLKELNPQAIRNSLGCIDGTREAPVVQMSGISKVDNNYVANANDAAIYFEYDKPITVVGLQIFGLADVNSDQGKINIFGSVDKVAWQKIAVFTLEDFVNKTFIESAWFANSKSYNFYKLQFELSDSPANINFANIKLRTEVPVGYFVNKIESFNDNAKLESYLARKYSPKDEIRVTSSSQHSTFGSEGLLNETKIWHAESPVKFPQYVNFDFPHLSKIKSIKLMPQDLVDRAPSEFKFIGSNDQTHWDVLLSVTKRDTMPTARNWLEYNVDSRKAYKYYRLVINDNYGSADFLTIQGVKFDYTIEKDSSPVEYPVAVYGPQPSKSDKMDVSLVTDKADTLLIKSRTYNEIVLHGSVSQPGAWFIWKEAWHPDWKMYIDNKPVDILQADMAFMSAWVEPGEHEIVLKFAGNSGADKKYSVILGSMLPFMALLLI